MQLNCQMKLAHGGAEQDIEFSVEIFESREWHDKYKELEDEADEIVEKNEHQIFITRIKRIAVKFESVELCSRNIPNFEHISVSNCFNQK